MANEERKQSKELIQLHMFKTLSPRDASKLTMKERLKAISSFMFFMEKRDNQIKGQACANIRPQEVCIPKESAASLTMSIMTVFITGAIESHDRFDVAITDSLRDSFMQIMMRM